MTSTDTLTRRMVYEALRNSGLSFNHLHVSKHILDYLQLKEPPEEDRKTFSNVVSRLCSEFTERWQRCSRHELRFFARNNTWLNNSLALPLSMLRDKKEKRGGRPLKRFGDCSLRAKRLKTDHMLSRSSDELAFATERCLKKEGKITAAKIVNQATTSTIDEVEGLRKRLTMDQVEQISSDKALALIVDGKMGKSTYMKVKNCTMSVGAKVFPSYEKIQMAKARCYPDISQIKVTDVSGEVTLQALLDHASRRIFEVQREVLKSLPDVKDFQIIYKWGMDGSSDHAQFKMKSSENFSDSHMFLITVVPLQMTYRKKISGSLEIDEAVWRNRRPCSTRLALPLKFIFKKESLDLVQEETRKILEQINLLQPTLIDGSTCSHKLFMTMIDGKICNFLTDTKSAQVCNVCDLRPSQMNDWCKVQMQIPKEEVYKYGLPVLHAKIRTFECMKNIGCRLDFQEYQVKSPENKLVFSARKFMMQSDFKSKMGLLVDQPRSGGVGNSNDGNTARRAFAEPELFAEVCGVSVELIKRIATILEVISCGYAIDINAFKLFCTDTWHLYVNLYSWYWMPSSLHKLLVHGPAIVSSAPLPIGCFSEEAQESRNKDVRRIRLNGTRKMSWETCHKDLMNALFISSDPVISSLRELPAKTTRNFSPQALSLLCEPQFN